MNQFELPKEIPAKVIPRPNWLPPKPLLDFMQRSLEVTCEVLGNVTTFEIVAPTKNRRATLGRKVWVSVLRRHVYMMIMDGHTYGVVIFDQEPPEGSYPISQPMLELLLGRNHSAFSLMMKGLLGVGSVNGIVDQVSNAMRKEYEGEHCSSISRDGRNTEGEETTQAGRDMGDGLRSVELRGVDCLPADPDRQAGEGVQGTGGIAGDDQDESCAIPADVAKDVMYARGGH